MNTNTRPPISWEKEGEPVAAGRIRYLGDYAKLERIAVRKAYRGTGIGHQLVDYMVSISQQNGFSAFKMHAQAHLTDFYENTALSFKASFLWKPESTTI
jgi:predicted GNAT family N-acyltransferase